MGVRLAVAATELVEEAVRGLNSVAEILSRGEPKGDGETGLLLPPVCAVGDAMLPTGLWAVNSDMPVVDRLESVRFQGRWEALGEPDPMTPGCCRGLAVAMVAADVGVVDAPSGEPGCCGVASIAVGS